MTEAKVIIIYLSTNLLAEKGAEVSDKETLFEEAQKGRERTI